MADATVKVAPLNKEPKFIEVQGHKVKENSNEHLALTQEFDPIKRYVFQLVSENMDLEHPVFDVRLKRNTPHKKYKPFQNLVYTSQIVWNGGRTNIRYYDGCESIFVSQQPKEKDIVDQLIQSTKRRNFMDGQLIVEGYDGMLLRYLSLCGWNADSLFRTNTAYQIFVPMNADKRATEMSLKMDKIEEAMKLAREATITKMKIHSSYLGISMTEYHSGNALTDKEIRTAYREVASNNPQRFIDSYGNKTIEVKYFIEQALLKGTINNKLNPNKAAWASSDTVICDISGLKSNEAIAQALFEFSQQEAGEEFTIQLKAISEA